MKFHQIIHKIEYKTKDGRYLKNIFSNVEWFHSFECDYSVFEVNKLLTLPPVNLLSFQRIIINNSDFNYMSNTGICPLYWFFNLDEHKKNYGHSLISEESLKKNDLENYKGLVSYLRNKKIETILNGFFI